MGFSFSKSLRSDSKGRAKDSHVGQRPLLPFGKVLPVGEANVHTQDKRAVTAHSYNRSEQPSSMFPIHSKRRFYAKVYDSTVKGGLIYVPAFIRLTLERKRQ